MIARSGETRRRHLRICALAMGLGDKGVSLLYERVLRKEKQLDLWVERCKSQISGVLDVLEKERAAVKTPYWFGENIGHADIAVALRAAIYWRGASQPVRCALSGAEGAFGTVRGIAGVPGDRASAGATEELERNHSESRAGGPLPLPRAGRAGVGCLHDEHFRCGSSPHPASSPP